MFDLRMCIWRRSRFLSARSHLEEWFARQTAPRAVKHDYSSHCFTIYKTFLIASQKLLVITHWTDGMSWSKNDTSNSDSVKQWQRTGYAFQRTYVDVLVQKPVHVELYPLVNGRIQLSYSLTVMYRYGDTGREFVFKPQIPRWTWWNGHMPADMLHLLRRGEEINTV